MPIPSNYFISESEDINRCWDKIYATTNFLTWIIFSRKILFCQLAKGLVSNGWGNQSFSFINELCSRRIPVDSNALKAVHISLLLQDILSFFDLLWMFMGLWEFWNNYWLLVSVLRQAISFVTVKSFMTEGSQSRILFYDYIDI